MTILSICIPTRNRAYFLEKTLKSIVRQKPFTSSDDIEIVISDNASTDNTKSVTEHFIAKYPKKIKYSCNKEDLGFGNLGVVLSKANGEFRKLHNDTLMMEDGALEKILNLVIENREKQPILFFRSKDKKSIITCNNIDEFLKEVSYYNTWIGSFGIWKDDFKHFNVFSEKGYTLIPQTYFLLYQIANGKMAVVFNDVFFKGLKVPNKGGYNIAEVFGKNYLEILKEFVAKKLLSTKVYKKEKKKILLDHIIPFYFDFKKQFSFQKTGYAKHLKDYKCNLYFYSSLLKIGIKSLFYKIIESITPEKKMHKKRWRKANKHNQTSPVNKFDLRKVVVGNHSYGPIEAMFYGNDKEMLILGSFVSIGSDVKFICGGNHPHDCFSTFPYGVKFLNEKHEATTKGPIVVKDDVWIGSNSLILSGVTIGQGAVIAAGSVIVKDVEPYSIVGGNPAKVIKYRFDESVKKKMIDFDFDIIDKNLILENKNILYASLMKDNADSVISLLQKKL